MALSVRAYTRCLNGVRVMIDMVCVGIHFI